MIAQTNLQCILTADILIVYPVKAYYLLAIFYITANFKYKILLLLNFHIIGNTLFSMLI